jgi:hypothetical protein
MPGESISQIPQQALHIGSQDLLMISQYTGNPSAPYVTKKAAVGLLPSVATFFAAGFFTLTPNATSTIVPVTGCLPTSVMPLPCPLYEGTGHAANDIPTTSYTMGTDLFTVNHANNPRTDRKFMFILFY